MDLPGTGPYAILRTLKLTTMDGVEGSAMHNFREAGGRLAKNADLSLTHLNKTTGATSSAKVLEAVQKRLDEAAAVKKLRLNAVLAVEYFIGASPEWFKDRSELEREAYFDQAEAWLRARHGTENVVAVTRQYDETSPHICAYVVPIDEKKRLNATHFFDREPLRRMQTDFAKVVGEPAGLQRGIEGSKASHTQVKKYYAEVNAAADTPFPQVTTPEPAPLGWVKTASKVAEFEAQTAKRAAEIQTQAKWASKTYSQAIEGARLKHEVKSLKRGNGRLTKQVQELASEVAKLTEKVAEQAAVVGLFSPKQIRFAQMEKQRLAAEAQARAAAEQVRQADVAAAKKLVQDAIEAAAKERAAHAAEATKRVADIEKLHPLRVRGGAEKTFFDHVTGALKVAGGDRSRVDWEAVEQAATREAMQDHGRDTKEVLQALLTHSPARVDPSTHAELSAWVRKEGPKFTASYDQEHGHGSRADHS